MWTVEATTEVWLVQGFEKYLNGYSITYDAWALGFESTKSPSPIHLTKKRIIKFQNSK